MSVAQSGRLRLMCRKTELCRFYQKGACKRGSACDFAHEEEVRAKPDLQRTKPCPTVADGQRCEGPNCPFAHYAGELRRFKPHLPVDQDAAASTKKRPGRAIRAENFLSNCSTTTSFSSGQANSDASSDCTGSLNVGSLKFSVDKNTADAGWSRQTTTCSDGGFGHQILDSSFGRQISEISEISDSGFGRQISDSGFGRQTSDSGFGRQISDSGFGRQLSACSEGEQRREQRKRYKTRMCSFYMMGKCRKDECTFAHGAHELSSRAGSKASACGDSRAGSKESAYRESRAGSKESDYRESRAGSKEFAYRESRAASKESAYYECESRAGSKESAYCFSRAGAGAWADDDDDDEESAYFFSRAGSKESAYRESRAGSKESAYYECESRAGSKESACGDSRAGSKESACGKGRMRPVQALAAPPQLWPTPPTESTSEGTSSEEPDSPGQQPSSAEEDTTWAPVTAAEPEEKAEWWLVVQNTFLTLVGGGTPKGLQRSSSTPPGK